MFAGKTSVAAVSLGVVLVGVGYQGAMGQTGAGVLAVSPADDFSLSGYDSSLSGKTKTYTLTNIGTGPLDWKATWAGAFWELSTPAGLLGSGGGGTLDAGASVTVTVTLASLPTRDDSRVGEFLQFSNLTNGVGSTSRYLFVQVLYPAEMRIGGGDTTATWIKGDTVSSVYVQEWSVINGGDYTVYWTAHDDRPWLTLQQHITGNWGNGWVDGSINPQASALAVGTYTATLTFSASGAGMPASQQRQTRTVTLKVVWPGDINADFSVDVVDLLWMVASLNKSSGQTGYSSRCDVNHDKTVDTADMLLFMANWGAVLE